MSKTTSKVLWILAGIFLIITGIGCLRNPGEILYGLPIIFGVAMMFSGIIDIVIFAAGHDYMAGSGWFLADGILTVLMSLFILGNGWFTAMTISFILGMWLIFQVSPNWLIPLTFKTGSKRLGLVYGTWNPADCDWFSVFHTSICKYCSYGLGNRIFLILQGIVSVMRGCFSNRFWL